MSRSTDANLRYVEVQLSKLSLDRDARPVLREVSWRLRPGERWVLMGRNGAGKTQLLKILSGSVWPTASAQGPGRRPARVYRWRGELFRSAFEVKESIAYLGPERQDQYERYQWNPTVMEVVGTGLSRTDLPRERLTAAQRKVVGRHLSRLNLDALAARRFLTLSYGERRLVLLARALATAPRLLLMDELLSGLDDVNRRRALRWLQASARSVRPWVLSTHRIEDVPRCATHALVLREGRVAYRGRLSEGVLERWLQERNRNTPNRRQPSTRSRGKCLVRLRGASVFIDGRRVLERVTFQVHAGECWVLHGRNGSGKTTLLRTLYGDHGVAVGGSIERAGVGRGVPLQQFQKRVGLVAPHLQSAHPGYITVMEAVQSGRHASIGLNATATATDRSAARFAIDLFELGSLVQRRLRELSYGQMRRVLFARAWSCRPALLLLDEPFSGVDAATRGELMGRLAERMAGGAALVIGTHHRLEWPSYASHELELSAGRVRYAGAVRSAPSVLPQRWHSV